jgi:hypothetical protein
MITRRQALLTTVAAPLISLAAPKPSIRIIYDEDLLGTESAAGYRRASVVPVARPVLVLAAARRSPTGARESFVLVECGPEYPGVRVQPERYIQFTWPKPVMIRSFGPALRFDRDAGEPIAYSAGVPIAVRRGNLVLLGAMLGPHLFAGDREAHELWNALLVRCAGRSYAGTSTTA